MTANYNDSPIETFEDDKFGVSSFATALATSIRNIKNPIGATIGLHGPWGSGKSSVVNLIRSSLSAARDDSLVVTEFKPWWFRGEEALALAFFQHLNSTLRDSFGDKVKGFVPSIGQSVLQAGPVLGTAAAVATASPFAALIAPAATFAKTFFPEGKSVEKSFAQLAKLLSAEHRRMLIIIDDIDRLSPIEALSIFRLVKSVGRLPNLIYLLVYDQELAAAAVKEHFPSEGPHFLEKIIQASFELPLPTQIDLNSALLAAVAQTCGEPSGDEALQRFMNVFYDVVVPLISTPRHVARFRNSISVTWPAIKDEVNLADFVALETLRLYRPKFFGAIRANMESLCGHGDRSNRNYNHQQRFETLLTDVPENQQEFAKIALMRLFPRLEDVHYGPEFTGDWARQRRVCIDRFFETYFRLMLSSDALPAEEMRSLIENAGDQDFMSKALRSAAARTRARGTTMIPVLLNELTTHAPSIAKKDVAPLVTVIFALHDEIYRAEDEEKGFYRIGNTTLRIHWLIRRLTEDRFTLEERSDVFISALRTASLGWLVDFASSVRELSRKDSDAVHHSKLLTTDNGTADATALALTAIRKARATGALAARRDLANILYRWRDFSDTGAIEVKEWTDSVLGDRVALVSLARAFTSTSYSIGLGFGGLGDRVSVPKDCVQISDDTDILNVGAFINALEVLLSDPNLSDADRAIIETFLNAWHKRRKS